jgi:hypothetical protein
MNSTPSAGQTDPHDVAVAAILQAYEHVGRTEQLQRLDKQTSKLEQDVTRHPPKQQNRTAVPGRRPGRGMPLWGVTSLLVAACVSITVLAWRYDGDAAKPIIGGSVSERIYVSSLLSAKQEPSANPRSQTVGLAVADAALPQSAPLAETKPQGIPPKAAPTSPDFAQLLETVVRDIANLEHGIEQLKASQELLARENAKAVEQLKASQEQVARDSAKAVEQLKASQEQIARDNANATEQLKASQEQIARVLAKASEQNMRPKTSVPPPRVTATPMRKRVPAAPLQAGVQQPAAKPEQP